MSNNLELDTGDKRDLTSEEFMEEYIRSVEGRGSHSDDPSLANLRILYEELIVNEEQDTSHEENDTSKTS